MKKKPTEEQIAVQQINGRLIAGAASELFVWDTADVQQRLSPCTSLRTVTSLKRSQMLINTLPYFYPRAFQLGGFVLGVSATLPHVARRCGERERENAGDFPTGRPAR